LQPHDVAVVGAERPELVELLLRVVEPVLHPGVDGGLEQLVGVLGMIIHYTYEIDWYVVSSPVNFHVMGYWFVIVSVWLGLWSGFMYFWGFIQGIGQVKAPAK